MDVDVQLYDGTSPLIAWCEKKPKTRASQITKGCGLLPSNPDTGSEESTTYSDMRITYSGYGGVGGNPGKEFITIQGQTTTTLTMRAFAFEAGDCTRGPGGPKFPCSPRLPYRPLVPPTPPARSLGGSNTLTSNACAHERSLPSSRQDRRP